MIFLSIYLLIGLSWFIYNICKYGMTVTKEELFVVIMYDLFFWPIPIFSYLYDKAV